MRRLLAGIVVVLTLAPSSAAMATGYDADYYDGFHEGNYSGNIGSLDFSGPWAEFGDAGGGGYSSGWVHVAPENCSSNKCLHIEGSGLFLASFGARRFADLSDFESATLSYDINVIPLGLTTTSLLVQVYADARWVTVREYDLSVATQHHKEIDVSQYADEGFGIRFVVPNVTSGELLDVDVVLNGYIAIDNVRVVGLVSAGSETTTSTSSPTTSSTSTTISSKGATTTMPGATTTSVATTSSTTLSTAAGVAPSPTTSTTAAPQTTITLSTTTTSIPRDAVAFPGGPPPGSGLRRASVGLMADYMPGMMGDMSGIEDIEVLSTDVQADFPILVETFGGARMWVAALALLIAAAVVSGMDWRRSKAGSVE